MISSQPVSVTCLFILMSFFLHRVSLLIFRHFRPVDSHETVLASSEIGFIVSSSRTGTSYHFSEFLALLEIAITLIFGIGGGLVISRVGS